MTFNSLWSQASCELMHFYCLRWSEASCSPFQSVPCHEPSKWSWPSFPCQPLWRPDLVSSPLHWLPFSDLPVFEIFKMFMGALQALKAHECISKPCKHWSHSFSSCSSPILHPTPIPHPVNSLLNRSRKSVGNEPSVQFSHSVMSDSVTPWTAACQASLSITNSQALLKLMSITSVMPLEMTSHPLSSPSPPAFHLSQHQGLFQWVSSSHQVAKVLEFQLQHQSFQWTPRTDFL